MFAGRFARRILGTLALTALLLSSPPSGLAAEHSLRKGAFAFQYAPRLTDEQLAWYSRFEVLVTHDPLPPEQVRVLHEAGTKLLFYEWSVAFYGSRATPWQRSLLQGSRKKLLSSHPLRGGVGSADADAWYFDPAAKGFAAARAEDLVRRLETSGYDGIFFDTTRFESVHPDARSAYERRHPQRGYDSAFGDFLATLRKRIGARLLFTNQGYRDAGDYLPSVQWDLTESLITRPVTRQATLRAWNDPHDPWNSILFVMRTMIEPLVGKYPNVHLAHLNYIDAAAPEVIRTTVAVAQLFGGEAYVAADALAHEQDAIYFRDPGLPVAPRVEWPDGSGTHRFFDRGLIAISASPIAVHIEIAGRALRNHFTGEIACGSVVIPPSPAAPTTWFFDEDGAGKCRCHE